MAFTPQIDGYIIPAGRIICQKRPEKKDRAAPDTIRTVRMKTAKEKGPFA